MKFSQIPYTRPNFEELNSTLDSAINKFKLAKSANEQVKIFDSVEDLFSLYNSTLAIARIRTALNSSDEFYKKEYALLLKNTPVLLEKYKQISTLLEKSEFIAELRDNIGSVKIKNLTLYNKTISNDTIEDTAAEGMLVNEYLQILSKLSVYFDDRNTPLSMLASYREHADRHVRKKAFEAQGNCLNAVKHKLDDIFDSLVKVRTAQAHKLGFENYIELGYAKLLRNCYNNKDLAAFKTQVLQDIVPVCAKIYSRRQQRLGIDTLELYDLSLPFKSGAPVPKVNAKEIFSAGKQMYNQMHPKTAQLINMMLDNELIDVYTKSGKQPGGFCSYIEEYKYPFIFANFIGTSQDINVFTHEMGHALHKLFLAESTERQYTYPTLDIAETHSMSMEFLTAPWMDLFFKEDAQKYKLSHMENAITFIPYACAVDEFQHEIYANPHLTPKQRDEKWLELESLYRPCVDNKDIPFYCTGAGWQFQRHIYKSPFYYIDYALAQMLAFQFFIIHSKDKQQAFNLYFKLLENSCDITFVDLIKKLELQNPLAPGTIAPIANSISSWLDKNAINN